MPHSTTVSETANRYRYIASKLRAIATQDVCSDERSTFMLNATASDYELKADALEKMFYHPSHPTRQQVREYSAE